MSKPLKCFVSGSPAAATLAQDYGDRLQNMSIDEKLLAIQAISGALLDSFVNRDYEPSIKEQLQSRINEGYGIDNGLQESLTALDSCDQTQCLAILTALVAYSSEEFRQFGS